MNIILKRQCLCNTSDCAKCLGGNCVDDNCKIHTKEYKESRRQIQLSHYTLYTPTAEPLLEPSSTR